MSVSADAGGAAHARCVSPARYSSNAADGLPVELSLNGQDFTSDAPPFTYHEPALVRELLPASGSACGGTEVVLTGFALLAHTDIFCSFGNLLTAANSVTSTAAQLVAACLRDDDGSCATSGVDEPATAVRCVAPPAVAAGAESRLNVSFSGGDDRALYELLGAALVVRPLRIRP